MNVNGDVETGLSAPDLLDLDLSESEDKEFHFHASVQKTLSKNPFNDEESLASEDDAHNGLQNELLDSGLDDRGETSSVNSVSSRTGAGISGLPKKFVPSASIMRHVILRAVSSQLQSANEGLTVGTPSVMCAANLIGVGTTHGVIFCFDWSQRLRWKHEGDQDQGPVTAMALNSDSTRMLVGFARGMVLMLDAQDAKVLRTIPTDAHTYCTAVVHVKFTDSPALALLSDSGGSVFEIGLKRVLGVRSWDCKCIFSGSRGEVVTVEPLLLYNFPNHPLAGCIVVAMATLSKVLLVSLRPQTKLLFTQSLKAPTTTLPLLSWQFVVIQVADTSRVMDPVLAVARSDIIYFYQISLQRTGRISCHGLQSISLGFSLISCQWLTSRTVALVDTNETLHLLDVRTKQELEVLDLSVVNLVYNAAAFKGLATGGNVSKAMALAGQRAVYNSVNSFGNQLVVLGSKTLHVISIRFWGERIDGLVRENRYEDALRLAMDFYEERGKAVLGLKGAREVRQKLVKQKAIETLNTFVDKLVNSSPDVNCQEAVPLVVEYAIELGQKEMIFGKLWEGLFEGKEFFLEAIENCIMSGRISEVPPEIMQRLVDYQQLTNKWNELEACIQRVDVSCLDIEQVILTCKRQKLYNALISVWNRAMNDFTSPLFEFVPLLNEQITDGIVSEEGRRLGNLLLVYIASCLSGVPSDGKADHARQQIVRGLCSQHSQNADDDEVCFPYIRALLEFDTREFLNALVISFSDPTLTTQVKQRLVNIILQVMTDGMHFKSTEVAWVLGVLNSSAVGRSLHVDQTLYTNVVFRLSNDDDPTVTHDERQRALLQLIATGSLNDLSLDSLLQIAQSAEFHQVCAVLHEMRGEYVEVLSCHLNDPNRREHVFSFIEQSPHKSQMKITQPDTLKELLSIDIKKTGQLLIRHLPQTIPEVLSQLTDEETYNFLRGMIEESDLDSERMTRYVCLMCRFEPDKVLKIVRSNENIELDPAIKMAQEYGLDEVTAVLLERSGDLQSAFNVLLSRLQTAIQNGENDAERMTEELVSLAQRGAHVLDSKTSWLPLLMCLLKLNSHHLLHRVLSNADLNLVSELHLLMQHTRGTLGELRGLIMGLFIKCRDQRRMLEATKRLHMSGLHGELAATLAQAQVGCRVSLTCWKCGETFKDSMFVLRCGHGFHQDCLDSRTKSCLECFKD